MHKLAALCVRRPVFASVLILSLVVVGTFSAFQLGVDRFPKVELPFVTITTVLVGAAPEEIETEVTDKLEEAVNTISGIDELFSSSSEGVSVVGLTFELDKDLDVAAQEVRDRVNSVLGDLPRETEPPLIEKVDPDAVPVVAVALSGPVAVRELTELADKTLRRQLETVAGVGQIRILGGRERQINVVLDRARLAAVRLTPAEVMASLASQNVQIPGGRVEQGVRDLSLRTYGRVERPEELEQLPLALRAGTTVRLADVARVEDGAAEALTFAAVNGQPAVVLEVRKQSGTNTVTVVRRVQERLETLKAQLPPGCKLEVVRDQSEYITAAVRSVRAHLIEGSLFAAAIVWLFLRRVRPTLIAAIAIPSSLIATFGAMAYMGFSLNVITLLALTLSVGIVIDDAVVVLENIFRFVEEKGLGPFEAAVEGTKEVGLAVSATTLSLIAVFLPVAFMGGIVGRFMNSFGVTMAFAIAVSLLVSFTLTPMMAARWLRPKDTVTEGAEGSRQRGLYGAVERGYVILLDWCMAHRPVVVLVMLGVFASTVPLFQVVNKNFLPTDDESQFEVTVRAPEGASVAGTSQLLESISRRIREVPGVATTLITQGGDPNRTPNLGVIYVKLTPTEERQLDQLAVMERVRREVLPAYAALDLRTLVAPVSAIGAGSEAEVQFWLGGPDLDRLEEYSERLMADLRTLPGVVDVDSNLVVGKPELGVRIDREKAADLGVSVRDIAATLNVLVAGLAATDYYEHGEAYEVHVRAAPEDRRDAAGILATEVPSATLGTVRLADVVTIEEGTGPAVVNRINRRRQVLIGANLERGYSAQTVIDRLQAGAQALEMPPAYSYGLTGKSREQGKAASNFLLAFLLSFAFMYLILAAQFESWVHPITILLALPLTVPFALLSIVLLDQSLNIFSSLGVLVLFGIVKKNGILQIDHTNQLRSAGMPRSEAIRVANRDRLRPILMTTFAFVAGMVPLVVSSGTGSGTNRAIGTVILGGQLLALLLTLVATPVAYSYFDDLANLKLFSRLLRRHDREVIGT
ncbi:MAG TPA: efflux RND transporter permease subunit [Thermoanaerobaculia bacterium]|nr:efflux RND transporter permease subunit [Thermoanaerobaculia bacterium]